MKWHSVLPSDRTSIGLDGTVRTGIRRDGTGRNDTQCYHPGDLTRGEMGQGEMALNVTIRAT